MSEDTIRPQYYKSGRGNEQIIELIRDMPFSLGNAVKYVYRCREKNSRTEDLKKALWYLRDYQEHVSKLSLENVSGYTPLSEDRLASLLSRNDHVEKELIRGIYHQWLLSAEYEEQIRMLSQEIGEIQQA